MKKKLTSMLMFRLLFIFAAPFSAQAESLQCQSVPALMNVFLANHYSVNQLTPEVKGRVVNLFMKFIDPNKSLLLASEEKAIRQKVESLFSTMKSGNCAVLVEVQQTLLKKTEENLAWAKDRLGAKFAINPEAKIQSDSKKRSHPETPEQKKELMEAMLQTQVATLMAVDSSIDKAKTQLVKRYELGVKRMRELTPQKMIDLFAEAFSHALDPHSDYLTAENLEEFRINMNLSLEGIGVSLMSEDGYTIVNEIIPGGSTDRANALKTKDKIVAVAQDGKDAVSIIDMDLSDVVKMIRGKKGTKVTLTVMRQKGNVTETFKVTITRDKVDMKEQAAKVHYEKKKIDGKEVTIAVVDLPSFYGGDGARDCYQDLKRIVEEAQAKKVSGMILDLSTNGGGLLQDAVKIAGLFIKVGPVVATQDGKKNREILSDDDARIQFPHPLMILITRQSASASEILAGAMKDYGRALIVGGDHTYGKGSVQVLNPLPLGLGGMKLTTQMFYLPGGNSTQNIGVSSDIALPTYLDDEDLGEQFMDYALPPAKTTAFIRKDTANEKEGGWTPVSDDLVKFLKEKSSPRVQKNAEFQEILKDIEDSKKNGGFVKVSDLLKKSSKDKEKRKDRKEKSSTAKGRMELWLKSPLIQESISMMQDWLTWNSSKK